MNYTILSIIFGLLNLLHFFVFWAYHYLVTTNPNKEEKLYHQVLSIKTVTDAFFFVILGVFVLFGGISLVGRLINTLTEAIGLDKAISMEECFLINFVILFANIGVLYMNKIHTDFFEQFKIARTNIKTNEPTT